MPTSVRSPGEGVEVLPWRDRCEIVGLELGEVAVPGHDDVHAGGTGEGHEVVLIRVPRAARRSPRLVDVLAELIELGDEALDLVEVEVPAEPRPS